MRTVDAHLLEEKMDEVVTHYINSHPHSESVNVDTSSLGLNIQEENGTRIVTLMHPQGFSSQMSREYDIPRAEGGGEGWSEELLDPEVRIAALAAHLAQQSRVMHHQMSTQHKAVPREVESSVILDRLGFNGQALDHQPEPIVVEVPSLPSLPPLQGIKRCQDQDWFKTKTDLKDDGQILSESDLSTASPAAKQQSKKSLPHKKRISRKLKRNTGGGVCADDLVVLNCSEAVQHEEILPDSYVTSHTGHMTDEHHIGHEVRPVFICQLCAAFFGGDQLKFYQHLKQHYEPHATIIIENPVSDLGIDKMTNTCIVDNVATLPDSIVELSLESTMHKTIYPHQAIDRHILYTTSDKLQYSNKVQYSMASIDKEVHTTEAEKQDLYESLEKVELYSCTRCHRNFRKQKQCEAHIRDVHSKLEELNEFSEPEDLMEGIHVSVSVSGEEPEYAPPLLPPLQDHHSYRYSSRLGGSGGHTLSDEPCDLYHSRESHHEPHQLKEEVFQRIFDGDIDNPNFSSGIINEESDIPPEAENPEEPDAEEPKEEKTAEPAESKKDLKKFSCGACPRVFNHRNSLLYHSLSHKGKRPHQCTHCGKGFYTKGALKVHIRVHNGDKPYKCDECGRDFRQWGDLKYHIISIHTEKKHFKCEFCGKEFSRKYSLNVHRRIHTGEKNYKCEYCVKTFRTSSYRLTHMRTHTGYKPHKCEQCDKCFRVCADLRRHMLTHERVRNRLQEVNKDKKDPKQTKKNNPKSNAKPDQERKEEIIVKNHAKEAKNDAKPLILKSDSERKPKAKKAKKGAPNVTVSKSERAPEVNDYPSNVEVYDSRYKFKEVYNFESGTEYKGKESYTEPIQPRTEARDFATLRPMMRTSLDDSENKTVFLSKHENTDGKMTVFTHVEKPKNYSVPIVANTQVNMGDMRPNLELREGRELQSDSIENGFFERFNESAFYNIPAV